MLLHPNSKFTPSVSVIVSSIYTKTPQESFLWIDQAIGSGKSKDDHGSII
ncbi:hypothetical protein VCHA53O466_50121 [Vibrio chagasii]|nr:hypothetical protein VCHA53O466_50121 [Vibrio chagasii]